MTLFPDPAHKTAKFPWPLVFIFSLFCVAILSLGYLYYDYQVTWVTKAKESELNAIADLKVRQVSNWRQERLNDAQLIAEDAALALQVHDWFDGTWQPRQLNRISRRLDGLRQGSYVAAAILDLQGEVRLSIPTITPDLFPQLKMIALEAIRTGKVILYDLYLVPHSEEINMSLAVPIRYRLMDKTTIVGVVICQIDPHYYLYPLLQSGLALSNTAEVVMVRREMKDNDMIVLNELRHRKGVHLVLRTPLTKTARPSVKAVLGEEGIVQGMDYRGVAVLAANRIIPGSPWFLTVKIDVAEVNAPLRLLSYFIIIITITLMTVTGLGIALIWRNRDSQFYRQQYESELERRGLLQRYEYLTKYANDIILIMDHDFKIVEANDRAVDAYGYTRDELLNLKYWDLIIGSSSSLTEPGETEWEDNEGRRFEAASRRRDGTTFPVEISSSILKIGDNRMYQYIVRDVSERKIRERTLLESEQRLHYLSSQLLIVQEKERSRISKELHDELGQALMVLKFQINSLESRLPKKSKNLQKDCGALLHDLDNLIENVRRLSWDLSPAVLEQFGLFTAIKNLLREFEKHYEVQWEPDQIEAINNLFPSLSKINIYRIFQESLTNVGKHAQATKIVIRVEKQDNNVIFTIEDNGKGFDSRAVMPQETQERGIGLVTMQERARLAGGSLRIWSRPGEGTRLLLTIPVEMGE